MKRTLLKEAEDWRWYAKGLLMAAVAAAGVLETQEVPAWLKVASRVTVAVGATVGNAGTNRPLHSTGSS